MKKTIVIIPTICLILAVTLEVLASSVDSFVIFYVDRIFPIISLPLAYISNLFPFSVGGVLLILGVILILTALIWGIILVVHRRENKNFYFAYLRLLFLLIGIYSLILVLNCFVLYQYPPMAANTSMEPDEEAQLLIQVRDMVVNRANELAVKMERDSDGKLIPRSYDELAEKTTASLRQLADMGYPRLGGYYPHFKYFINSKFFSKQYMMGYYYPFSMEANVNEIMYPSNYPHTICHELSHLKGYILEDEANFLGYLACMNSGDEFFEYSALLSVMGYLDRDFKKIVSEDEYKSHPKVSELVRDDDIFLTDETWEEVNASGIFDTETVHDLSTKFTDTVLTSNGVSDGRVSYSRVVRLMLNYYAENAGELSLYLN